MAGTSYSTSIRLRDTQIIFKRRKRTRNNYREKNYRAMANGRVVLLRFYFGVLVTPLEQEQANVTTLKSYLSSTGPKFTKFAAVVFFFH